MSRSDNVTYTLFFGIIPDQKGKALSVRLAYVWDSNNGSMVDDFEPSVEYLKNAELQFMDMNWNYHLNERGEVNEQTGYCYYFEKEPNLAICSNNLDR